MELQTPVNRMPSNNDTDAIIQKLTNKKNPVEQRMAAIESLANLADSKSLNAIVKALGSKDEAIVHEAKKALKKLNIQSAKPLSLALYSKNWRLRKQAAKLLNAKEFGVPGKLAVISHDLASKNLEKYVAAMDTLRSFDASAVEPIAATWEAMIKAPTIQVRANSDLIIDTLGYLGPAATDALINILKIGDWPAKCRAITALANTRNSHAPSSQLMILKNKNMHVKNEAKDVLGALGDSQFVDLVIGVFPEKEDNQDPSDMKWLHQCAIGALSNIKSPKAINFIVKELGNIDPYINYTAMEILKHLGSEAIPQLIAALGDLDKDVRNSAGEILVSIPELSLEPLLHALEANDFRTRIEAAWLLGEIANVKAKEPLLEASKSSDKELQITASKALKKIGPSKD